MGFARVRVRVRVRVMVRVMVRVRVRVRVRGTVRGTARSRKESPGTKPMQRNGPTTLPHPPTLKTLRSPSRVGATLLLGSGLRWSPGAPVNGRAASGRSAHASLAPILGVPLMRHL